MKIGIRFGHMENGADGGACGILKETDVNREYGAHVITYLMRAGHEVINCTPKTASSLSDSLCQGVDIANNNGCDIFLSLHVNAGGGKGCEVLYYGNSEASKIIADRISNSISTICNYIDRGGKSDVRGLYELKHTNMKAFIIEPFFCDNEEDCSKYKPELIAKAIVDGLLGSIPKKEMKEVIQLTAEEAIKVLVDKGVIASPEYWLKSVTVVNNLDKLIINMATKLSA